MQSHQILVILVGYPPFLYLRLWILETLLGLGLKVCILVVVRASISGILCILLEVAHKLEMEISSSVHANKANSSIGAQESKGGDHYPGCYPDAEPIAPLIQ
jgi:hypothetical protein